MNKKEKEGKEIRLDESPEFFDAEESPVYFPVEKRPYYIRSYSSFSGKTKYTTGYFYYILQRVETVIEEYRNEKGENYKHGHVVNVADNGVGYSVVIYDDGYQCLLCSEDVENIILDDEKGCELTITKEPIPLFVWNKVCTGIPLYSRWYASKKPKNIKLTKDIQAIIMETDSNYDEIPNLCWMMSRKRDVDIVFYLYDLAFQMPTSAFANRAIFLLYNILCSVES